MSRPPVILPAGASSSVVGGEEDSGCATFAVVIGGLGDHPDGDTLGKGVDAEEPVTRAQRPLVHSQPSWLRA